MKLAAKSEAITVVNTKKKKTHFNIDGYFFLIPKGIIFIAFVLIPFVYTFVLMFERGTMLSGFHFIGFENFKMVFHDQLFFSTLKHTFVFMLVAIPLSIILPLLIGMFLASSIRGIKIYRTLIYLPSLLSIVVTGVVWEMLLNPNGGPLYTFFKNVFDLNIPWMDNGTVALIMIALISVWQSLGFNSIIFMAGFNDIPHELLEAAFIDGATRRQAFLKIQIPMLKPIIQLVLVLVTISTVQVFDIVFVMTNGGPGTSTYTVMWYIYQNVFNGGAIGYAAVMGVFMLVITLIIAVFYMRSTRTEASL